MILKHIATAWKVDLPRRSLDLPSLEKQYTKENGFDWMNSGQAIKPA